VEYALRRAMLKREIVKAKWHSWHKLCDQIDELCGKDSKAFYKLLSGMQKTADQQKTTPIPLGTLAEHWAKLLKDEVIS
jgi:hypothetical protein